MHHLSEFEKVLINSGVGYQSNKVIDDYLLTGNISAVRDSYRCCQEHIADMMVEFAELDDDFSILEPGAGKGCILKRISHFTDHSYCEINSSFLINNLSAISKNFETNNFFELQKKFDRIIMNPPFSFNQYVNHILHAYTLLNTNGIMVFLYPKNAEYLLVQNKEFIDFLDIADKKNVGKVCGECECVIGKIIK